jgi:hypothetical protein
MVLRVLEDLFILTITDNTVGEGKIDFTRTEMNAHIRD